MSGSISSLRPLALLIALVLLAACARGTNSPAPAARPERDGETSAPAGTEAATPPAVAAHGTDRPLPPGHPPVGSDTGAAIAPPEPGAGTGANAVAWSAPPGWEPEPPSSPMRKAQYRVPGPGGDGECVIYYFGPGQGGDAMSNAKRWASQFTVPGGAPAADRMKTSSLEVSGMKVLQVEITGTYVGGMGSGMGEGAQREGYMLLGAVAEGPDSNWFFKFTGPEKTVRDQREAFSGLIRSLRHGS